MNLFFFFFFLQQGLEISHTCMIVCAHGYAPSPRCVSLMWQLGVFSAVLQCHLQMALARPAEQQRASGHMWAVAFCSLSPWEQKVVPLSDDMHTCLCAAAAQRTANTQRRELEEFPGFCRTSPFCDWQLKHHMPPSAWACSFCFTTSTFLYFSISFFLFFGGKLSSPLYSFKRITSESLLSCFTRLSVLLLTVTVSVFALPFKMVKLPSAPAAHFQFIQHTFSFLFLHINLLHLFVDASHFYFLFFFNLFGVCKSQFCLERFLLRIRYICRFYGWITFSIIFSL